MANRYTDETLRLAGLMKSLAHTKQRSIRSIEEQMGVGTSIFHRVLKGDVTLQVRHLLMIADALEIPWAEFFHLAYPRRASVPAKVSGSVMEDLDAALAQDLDEESPEFAERVKRVLLQLGLLEEAAETGAKRARRR